MPDRIEHLAARVAGDPSFLAHVLADYARAEHLDDPALAIALGCPPHVLPLLRLCRHPRPDPALWRADIETIAVRFVIEPALLAEILRRADALAALRAADGREQGALMAARDREMEEPEP